MERRGQAALEFLTTYGWAFLVILIMIGALAYFGVLNPKGMLPGRCTFSPEISCQEYTVFDNGTLKFRFLNNVGATADFNITNITYLGGNNPSTDCGANGDFGNVLPGRIVEVTCDFGSGVLARGEKAKFEVKLQYKKADGNYYIPINGEIYAEVREGS